MAPTQGSPRDIHELWQAHFRHGAGALTSHFLRTLRDEARLVGWRSGTPARVVVPPQDLGTAGEWVEVGPQARLVGHAGGDGQDVLGLVALDGAHGCSYWRVRCADPSQLRSGTRLVARFA